MQDTITKPLLKWYGENKRVLPWREKKNPYEIWVSEIMLQQTRVEAVKPFYERFMRELPNVAALAVCPEEKLLKLWEGLGYYNRVRNMQKAAQKIMEVYDGVFPADYEALKGLPGIGNYTAGAVASIAFCIPVPAVDGNVLRVMARLREDGEDILKQSVKNRVEAELTEIMPAEDPGAFNQAMMDLGAMVCRTAHQNVKSVRFLTSVWRDSIRPGRNIRLKRAQSRAESKTEPFCYFWTVRTQQCGNGRKKDFWRDFTSSRTSMACSPNRKHLKRQKNSA